jgi:hypothetical protein
VTEDPENTALFAEFVEHQIWLIPLIVYDVTQ